MIRTGIYFAFAARADDVARTILLIAKKRPTAMDSLLLVRLSRIQWRIRPLRIARDASFVCERFIVISPIPVAAPFPNVSGHVVKAVAIRRKRFHRGYAGVTVFACIFHWKCSLPRIGHPFSVGTKFVAPHVCLS